MSAEQIRALAKQRKAQFEAEGRPVSEWADAKGFRRSDVYRVLNGLSPCKRGAFHQIAVALGIKPSTRAGGV